MVTQYGKELKDSKKLKLKDHFMYTHHPLENKDEMMRFFYGRNEVIEELKAYCKQSRGGSILVTGYRGVGKTSLVNQIIVELNNPYYEFLRKNKKHIKVNEKERKELLNALESRSEDNVKKILDSIDMEDNEKKEKIMAAVNKIKQLKEEGWNQGQISKAELTVDNTLFW